MERAEASRRTIAFRLGAAAFMIAALIQAGAQNASAQQASSQRAGGAIAGAENNDEDFTRPENLIQLRFLYETAPGSGSLPGTIRTVTTGRQVLRTDTKVDVAPEWSLALRGDLPFSEKDPISSENPSGRIRRGPRRCRRSSSLNQDFECTLGRGRRAAYCCANRRFGYHQRQMAGPAHHRCAYHAAGIKRGQLLHRAFSL